MNITMWADGYGLWHARVPMSNDPKSDKLLAQAAIIWQLNDRQPLVRVTRKMVPVVLVGEDRSSLTVHYQEKTV